MVRPLTAERSHGLAGWVIEHRQPALIPDVSRDRRWIPFPARRMPSQRPGGPARRGGLGHIRRLPAAVAPAGGVHSRRSRAGQRRRRTDGLRPAAWPTLRRSLHERSRREEEATRQQQADSSRAQAILKSIADGVLVTGPAHHVTLCNAAAERILRIERASVVGQPAAQWIGVYGPAGRRWAEALQAWSQNPPAAAEHASLADRLELEDRARRRGAYRPCRPGRRLPWNRGRVPRHQPRG